MNPFSALTSKIFAGVSAFLLIALALSWWHIGNLNDTIEAGRNELAQCNAARAEQNAAIARAGQEAERTRLAFTEASQRGAQGISQAQERVRVVRQTVNSGCRTPDVVMGAGL